MPLTPMLVSTKSAAFGVVDGLLYVAGGWLGLGPQAAGWSTGGGKTDLLQVFDPMSNTWAFKAPMPIRLFGSASCSHDGKLYVFGGSTVGGPGYPSRRCFAYDPQADQWKELAPMPSERGPDWQSYIHKATVHQGRAFVLGGGPCAPPFVYDFEADVWKLVITSIDRKRRHQVRPASNSVAGSAAVMSLVLG